MKIMLILLAAAVFLAACRPAEPKGVYAVEAKREEAEAAACSVSFYKTAEGEAGDRQGTFSRAYIIKNLNSLEYDPYKGPFRFEGDLSVWVTNGISSQFGEAVLGKCISSEEEIAFIRRVLIDASYEDRDVESVPLSIPVFLLRKGTDCDSCSDRIPPGATGHIDDMLYQYTVLPDGTVLRLGSDESRQASAQPLSPEDTARLYLIYHAYMLTKDIFVPGQFMDIGAPDYTLCVERNGKRTVIPKEKWAKFISLVTVDEDRLDPDVPESPCCKITNFLYPSADHSSPEVLRFIAVPPTEDIENIAASRVWFSLREDGALVRTITQTAGASWPRSDRWEIRVPVMQVSKRTFDTAAVGAFVDACEKP